MMWCLLPAARLPGSPGGSSTFNMRIETAASRRSDLVGVMLLITAATLWSLSGAFIKMLNADGAGPSGVVIAWYRSLIAGLFLLPLAIGKFHTLRAHDSRYARWPIRPASVWCAIFFATMTVCYVTAMTLTEAGSAILLQYTSNIWVFLLSPLLLGERPSLKDIWVLVLAMIGVGIIFWGEDASGLPGLLTALASGLFYGLLTLMIRRMKDCNSAAVSVVNNLGAALLILPIVLYLNATNDDPGMNLAVSPRSFVLLALLGVVQFGLPYYLFTLGLARVPAYKAGLIVMIELVLVPICAYVAVGETMPERKLIGGGLILLALIVLGLLAARAQSKMKANAVLSEG